MLIYLSHPIDRAESAVADKLSRMAATVEFELEGQGVHLFRPRDAFWVGEHSVIDNTIEAINTEAQSRADGVLVLWPKGAKSWGVPVEVERARQNNQPVAIISDDTPTWSQPWGWTHKLIKRFDYHETDKAIAWLLSQMSKYEGQAKRVLNFKRLSAAGQRPTRAYSDDAGLDLYVSETMKVKPGQFVDIPCSVAVELPSNTWALLTGRSSTLRKHGLLVNQGIIDPGYRGELFAGVQNLGRKTVTVQAGERVAQLILMPNWTSEFNPVEVVNLKSHPRGEKGFGSSGR